MNFIFPTAMTCLITSIAPSCCEFRVVEVRASGEVTLLCPNQSKLLTNIYWFKMGDGPNVSYVSSMKSPNENATPYSGIVKEKFHMTSNMTNLFLRIKVDDFSDGGLYMCGLRVENLSGNHTAIFGASYLKVHEENDLTMMMGFFGGLCLFFNMIIIIIIITTLVVKFWKLHTAHKEEQDPQRREHPDTDDLNYAALSFRPREKRSRGSAPVRELSAVDNGSQSL